MSNIYGTHQLGVLLGINIIGAFLLAWLRPSPVWGTGFLGGLTSFSAYIAASASSGLFGIVYILITPLMCLCAAAAGNKWRTSARKGSR
ncbi:fluoride ion transporter CrcB [Corynebacterium choanae]|uniref:fluoride ion transporter CrcB n=1 Tax=Corynebacterium choanae TaxID=1862358 RepID=UPI001FE7893E